MNRTSTVESSPLRSDQSLQHALHRLWTDHVFWTREYLVSAIADTPDVHAAANRLLKNQEDIGNAIVPIYGEAAGAALTDLLKQHILIAVDLVAAAKVGDNERFAAEDEKWNRNAVDIAVLLASANPNWDKRDIHDLVAQHLELTRKEAVARLTKDWAADIAAYDDIMTEIMTLADSLSSGIVKQFPERFVTSPGTSSSHASDSAAWNLRLALDRLWADHAMYTRNYIVAGLAGAEETQVAAERLLKNQEDIGNAIVPFYGETAGAGLTELLKQHILIAAEMVGMAHRQEFGERFDELERSWNVNAAHIAGYLNALNPYWSVKDVQDLLAQHLSLTEREVQARYEQDWETDVQLFDDILTEILTMSGALAAGLIRQFPERFQPSEEDRVPQPRQSYRQPTHGYRVTEPSHSYRVREPASERRIPQPAPARRAGSSSDEYRSARPAQEGRPQRAETGERMEAPRPPQPTRSAQRTEPERGQMTTWRTTTRLASAFREFVVPKRHDG
ncbi:MAG TPA: hypothetical protein VHJ78_08170 [Actinomycetota bacterium]|nr:hypothetical protein [Actinomycetota bacterium]